jgi:hypothetical protein
MTKLLLCRETRKNHELSGSRERKKIEKEARKEAGDWDS